MSLEFLLEGQHNGLLSADLLVAIAPTIVVLAELELPFKMMRAHALKDGIVLEPTKGYVPYDLQDIPGTMDNGWGMVIDFDISRFATFAWLDNFAWEYCFEQKNDLNHWVYNPTIRRPK